MCSEADAATGMVATNSVAPKTGNISGNKYLFNDCIRQIIEKRLSEVDIVTTPMAMK